MLPTAATDFYALQQRVNFAASNETGRLWRRMGDDFDASWRRYGPSMLAVLTEAQSQVALAAVEYVPAVLAETDIPDRPTRGVRPGAFVGVASDGRSLESLAYQSVVTAKVAVSEGAATGVALDQGGTFLDLMVKLQVADAARQVVGVMTASRKNLSGTVRVLNPPSCQRCAILAGRFYRWSKGFERHPRCDCVNLPSQSAGWAKSEGFITDPMDAYRAGQIKDLTGAQIKALSEGADIGQVVNAYRGMSTTATETAKSIRIRAKLATSTRPAIPAGQPDLLGFLPPSVRPPRQPRVIPTPEGIYRQTAGDRDKAIELLREFGYLT